MGMSDFYGSRTDSDSIKTLINEFQYPRFGPGQMWEMATEKIRALGGEVLMRHEVEAVETRDGRVVAVPPDPLRKLRRHVRRA